MTCGTAGGTLLLHCDSSLAGQAPLHPQSVPPITTVPEPPGAPRDSYAISFNRSLRGAERPALAARQRRTLQRSLLAGDLHSGLSQGGTPAVTATAASDDPALLQAPPARQQQGTISSSTRSKGGGATHCSQAWWPRHGPAGRSGSFCSSSGSSTAPRPWRLLPRWAGACGSLSGGTHTVVTPSGKGAAVAPSSGECVPGVAGKRRQDRADSRALVGRCTHKPPAPVLCRAGSVPGSHLLRAQQPAASKVQGEGAPPPAGAEHEAAAAEVVHDGEAAAAEAPSEHAQRQQSLREQLEEVRAQLEVRHGAANDGC